MQIVFDGDLVLVVDNTIMKSGVRRNIPFVVDIEDKVTALAESVTQQNILQLVLRNFNSLIGEASNAATTYHSIKAKTQEQAKRYQDYIDTLSVVTGKSIDFAKTGVMFNIPRHIAKYAKPLPYFMKYRSDYYKGLHKFRNNNSNMNMMCRMMERWEKVVLREKLPNDLRYQSDRNISFLGRSKRFDYTIMMDNELPYGVEEYGQIEKIYLDFCENVSELAKEQYRVRRYAKSDSAWMAIKSEIKELEAKKIALESKGSYMHANEVERIEMLKERLQPMKDTASAQKAWVNDNFPTMKKEDMVWYTVNWQYYYNSYKLACQRVVSDPCVLANIVVDLAYRKYKSKSKNFLWIVASEGVLLNIKQQSTLLPLPDDSGEIVILGKNYRMVETNVG